MSQIDERAFDAFMEALECFDALVEPDERAEYTKAIEAYEAELWRPIQEAPHDGTHVLIAWDGVAPEAMNVCWIGDPRAPSGWTDGYKWIAEGHFPNAMFRTIEPPATE